MEGSIGVGGPIVEGEWFAGARALPGVEVIGASLQVQRCLLGERTRWERRFGEAESGRVG